MDLILISGLSGSGKSVALHLLEDAGYYCVDNLPAALLQMLVHELRGEGCRKAAVAIDMRGGDSIQQLPLHLSVVRDWGVRIRLIFLEAKDETLLKRFSETRRRHPLANAQRTLAEAVREERKQLAVIAGMGHRIDTSDLKANTLREWIRQFIEQPAEEGLILLFTSFGFKYGLPLDADLVFDVRCLPNPYYEPALRPLTGQDQAVIDFLESQPAVLQMREDIRAFVARWLPAYIDDHRSYLTVGIGCTGGQHRSVHIAEWLAARFQGQARILVRHRSLATNS
jgi:RNase adapter protein RapZ